MKTKPHQNSQDELDQLGGTDQIEQLAADLAVEDDRQRVTNKDRQQALKQMSEMAPPAVASPTAPPEEGSV